MVALRACENTQPAPDDRFELPVVPRGPQKLPLGQLQRCRIAENGASQTLVELSGQQKTLLCHNDSAESRERCEPDTGLCPRCGNQNRRRQTGLPTIYSASNVFSADSSVASIVSYVIARRMQINGTGGACVKKAARPAPLWGPDEPLAGGLCRASPEQAVLLPPSFFV